MNPYFIFLLQQLKVMDSVIRLSLGKLLVNLLQVVKRTINNTPPSPQQMESSTDHGFWVVGSNPKSTL